MKLVPKSCSRNTQRATRGGVFDNDGPEPELAALRNGSDDEDALLPIGEVKKPRNDIINFNLKVSSFLEVPSDADLYQFFRLVELPFFPRLEDSVSHSIPVMNIAFDIEVA